MMRTYEVDTSHGVKAVAVKRDVSKTFQYEASYSMFNAYGKTPRESVGNLLGRLRREPKPGELEKIPLA